MLEAMNQPKEENAPSDSGDKPKRGRGRPKGSKNKQRVVVHHIPERCPRCGHSEFTSRKTKKEWPRHGSPDPPYIVKRRRFKKVRWSYCRCGKCNHFFSLVEHLDEII